MSEAVSANSKEDNPSQFENDKIEAMIQSMLGPLMNKIKMSFLFAKKNKRLASNKDFKNLMFLVCEQLLP